MPVETELLSVIDSANPIVDIVFVHGLDGDPITTWRMNEPNSWAAWIKEDLPQASVWTLRYRLRAAEWQGGAMPLTTRSVNVLATLDTELINLRPIIFICHSYGGLLVKQLLRSASDVAIEYQRVTDRVAGIVFLGTPNSGSTIATFVNALKPLLQSSSAIEELRRSSPALQNLSYWFRNNANKWSLRVYFETVPTRVGIVVDESSADLGIASVIPIGIDADHISICTTIDLRVKQTFALVRQVIEKTPKPLSQPRLSWMSQIIATPNEQLHLIEADIEAELAERPGNAEARRALAHLQRLSPPTISPPRSERETRMMARSYSSAPTLAIALLLGFGLLFYDKIGAALNVLKMSLQRIF